MGLSTNELSVVQEGVSFAVELGRDKAIPRFRPGVVVSASLGERSAMVQPDTDPNPPLSGGDDALGGPVKASMWYAGGVRAGDRVQLMYYPPSGCAIVAVIAGGWEDWHFVGGEGEIPMGTGWINQTSTAPPYQSQHGPLMYRRIGRWVELRGRVERVSGADPVICILPNDYRPTNRVAFICLAGEIGLGINTIIVDPTGTVEVVSLGGNVDAPTGSQFLDGIVFSADVFPA